MEKPTEIEQPTLSELHALHMAFLEAMADAKEREGKMPSSAEAIRAMAANLRSLKAKILATMPEEQARNYR